MSTVPPVARATILLVEDDPCTRNALARWLAYEYDVVPAVDGVDALEIAAAMNPAPDLILTDVWMPRLDGVSMVRRVKEIETLRHVPVIFLTGQTSVQSVVAGICAGARAYLPKPIELDMLDRKVRSALSFRTNSTGRVA